ncbi:MAG: hypothetical protein GF317_12255 [Candidatus Lokiarchaeota archaeon]|nr:hypothetical protein [Candidatus Lokiarchaeota archaeon]MBD3200420.1 hypothetical protein [Candidatus Lokiarchaeota archaeon]
MENHTFKKIIKSKIFIFSLQIGLVNLFTILLNNRFPISFDGDILEERIKIIQYLANLILYTELEEGFIVIGTWIMITLIPILLVFDYQKATSANIKAFFFPNFFFYIFLGRYSFDYFDIYFWNLFSKTIIIFTVILILSILIPLIGKKIKLTKGETGMKIIEEVYEKNKSKCPYCGTDFDSIPLYCYNCSKKLKNDNLENIETEFDKK